MASYASSMVPLGQVGTGSSEIQKLRIVVLAKLSFSCAPPTVPSISKWAFGSDMVSCVVIDDRALPAKLIRTPAA